MKPNLTQRLAALVVAVATTFTVVWAHASLAYPAVTPATLLLAQAQTCTR